MTYLNPEPHRRTFMKPFMRLDSPEFCSSCHKVHLDVPVNDYRWFRGFNDYDTWQASGVSGQGARSFYYPPKSMTCVDCHMPLVAVERSGPPCDGTVHSHRFPAANTALPLVNKDEAQMKITRDVPAIRIHHRRHLRRVADRRDDRAARRWCAAPAKAPQLDDRLRRRRRGGAAGADRHSRRRPGGGADRQGRSRRSRPGSTVRVDVVVRTRKIGHFFPGGTVDAFDVWLELQARDADGRVIFWSGQVEDEGRGPVEPGAHFYRAFQLDGEGQSDQQAERVAGAQRAVCPADSAGRGRCGALPRQDPEGRAGPDHASRRS